MDALYPDMMTGKLEDEGKAWIRDIFSFAKFRDELRQLFQDNKLPALSDSQWHSFLAGFLNNVEDCSLKCPLNGAPLEYVDEVVLFKEGRSLNPAPESDGAPPIFWALCRGGELRFPMLGNAKLSGEAVEALVEFEKRRQKAAVARS